eukprot:419891-Amphidinium_carterae.1
MKAVTSQELHKSQLNNNVLLEPHQQDVAALCSRTQGTSSAWIPRQKAGRIPCICVSNQLCAVEIEEGEQEPVM